MKKHHIYLSVLLLVIITFSVVLHTILVSKGSTSFIYERVRDIAICFLAAGLAFFNLKKYAADSEKEYLIVGNLFILILTIHLLRLIHGGLLC